MNILRASRNEGENCRCSRYKCFEMISPEEQQRIISNFSRVGDYNKQNQYLSGFVIVPEASNHVSSYFHRVLTRVNDDTLQDVSDSHKAVFKL